MPDPILPKRVPLKGKAQGTMGPKNTYGKNRIGRGFLTDAKITVPVEAQYEGIIPRMFDGKSLSIPATTQAKINSDNANKWSSLTSITPVQPTGTGSRRPRILSNIFSNENINKVGKFANELSPYISNISNTFRKAPKPNVPILDTYTNLSKIDLSNERHGVKRTIDAANKATERSVDANTAEAIKAFNRGQEFNQLSSINERENNTNIGIGNQQAMMDAQIKAGNVNKWNDYGDAKTAAAIADVRERSANVANAGDKFTLIQNEKRKAKVERDKVRVLSSLYNKSGVLSRQAREWKKLGIEDPLGMEYSYSESDDAYNKRKDVKAYGGMMKKVPSRKLC